MGAADMEMPDTNAGADTGMDIAAADIKRAALRSAPVGAKRVPLARSSPLRSALNACHWHAAPYKIQSGEGASCI